jgi:hypothetical protein
LPAPHRTLSAQLLDGKLNTSTSPWKDLSEIDQARLYELGYDALRYRSADQPQLRDPNAKQSYELLLARSKLHVNNVWPKLQQPLYRSDQGHGSSRFAVGLGTYKTDEYLSLRFRPAYHDVLDPIAGYSIGSQINLLDINVRYNFKEKKAVLQYLTIIDILSLSARNTLIKPLSWSVNFGIERNSYKDDEITVMQLNGGAGHTYSLFANQQLSFFLDGKLMYHNKLSDNYALGSGPSIKWLAALPRVSLFAEARALRFFAGEQHTSAQLIAAASSQWWRQSAIRVQWKRQYAFQRYYNDVEIMWNWYF